jgi:hypothetical protein
MMNEKLIRRTIVDAIRGAMGPDIPVILADQNEPRPPRPYISYKLMTGPIRNGHDSESMDEDGDLNMIGERELSVSVNYYGLYAVEGMSALQTRLQFPSVRAILAQNKLVYVSDSGVRDVSQLLETQTETRAQMDVNLRLTVSDQDLAAGYFEEVEITDSDTGEVFKIDSNGGA